MSQRAPIRSVLDARWLRLGRPWLLLFFWSTEEFDAPLAWGGVNSAGGVAAGFAERVAVGSALGTLAGRNAGSNVVDDDAFEAVEVVD